MVRYARHGAVAEEIRLRIRRDLQWTK